MYDPLLQIYHVQPAAGNVSITTHQSSAPHGSLGFAGAFILKPFYPTTPSAVATFLSACAGRYLHDRELSGSRITLVALFVFFYCFGTLLALLSRKLRPFRLPRVQVKNKWHASPLSATTIDVLNLCKCSTVMSCVPVPSPGSVQLHNSQCHTHLGKKHRANPSQAACCDQRA